MVKLALYKAKAKGTLATAAIRQWTGSQYSHCEFVRDYFDKTDDQRYGWFALVTSQLFNMGISSEHSQFCSEWCASALKIPNPSAYSPQTLLEICELLNKVYTCTY